jgi:hypothetical protein
MDWTMGLLKDSEYDRPVIDTTLYADFERYWLMYYISGKRYGEAFCEHFHIGTATPLYYFKDADICKRWINDNYLEK